MFDFAVSRPRRRIGLTPMIDVVFLLLVFFMLVARFGLDQARPVAAGGAGAAYTGPPRLIDVAPGALRLNGVPMAPRDLLVDLVRLTETGADPVVLRPVDGADVARLVDVMDLMGRAGFETLLIAAPGGASR